MMESDPLISRTVSSEVLAQQTVEMVHAALAGGRVAPARIEARAHAALHGLHDRLVLGLDAIERGARAGFQLRWVGDVGAGGDARALDRERLDEVHRQAPRIEIE